MAVDVVLVIYNTDLAMSETYRSLFCDLSEVRDLNIIVYDNGLSPQLVQYTESVNMSYLHDPSNSGLAKAYNYALSTISGQNGWLLLLDQDSRLPANFISTLIETINGLEDESIVAVAPHIFCDNNVLSPCKVKIAGRLEGVSEQFTGVSDLELMAINSGMAVRASFLKQIGGFNQEFWLDYLDHWLCRTIYAEGKKIFVSPSTVHHSLSVSNYNEVSEKRALNILHAEVLFYSKYKSEFERIAYFFRLFARSIKQLIKLKNKKIAGYTFRSAISLLGK